MHLENDEQWTKMITYFAVVASVVFLGLLFRFVAIDRNRRCIRDISKNYLQESTQGFPLKRLMVVLGSGGHTAEMVRDASSCTVPLCLNKVLKTTYSQICLLDSLLTWNVSEMHVLVADTDRLSLSKVSL